MKVEKIAPVECGKCKGNNLMTVGWHVVEGYLCDCGWYTKKNGQIFECRGYRCFSKNQLFETDLRLIK